MKRRDYSNNLEQVLISFNVNLENLLEFVRVLTPILRIYEDKAIEKREALKNIIRGIPRKMGIQEDIIAEEKIEKAADEITNFLRAMTISSGTHKYQMELLYKTSFVMLISYFDYLVSDLIHCYYRMYPKALSGELSISFNELKQCYSLEEAIDFILNKKVESVLYGNLRSQMTYLKNDLKINLNEKIINWDVINEAVERRNIIVHNNSMVNRRYLNNVKMSGDVLKKNVVKEGEVLTVDGEYFKKIHDEIMLAGLLLVQGCWRKWTNKDIEDADKSLIFITEKALIREDWKVAERLGLFGRNIDINSDEHKYMLTFYYCESLKQQGRKEELNKELENINEEGLSPMFMATICALKDDKDSFYKYVKKVAEMGKIRKDVFYAPYDWPVFNNFRKDKDYKDNVEKAFSNSKTI